MGHVLSHLQKPKPGSAPSRETPSNPCPVPLGPTFSDPRATLPSHGTILLVLISTYTQEGPFHVFTESFPTYTTEQLTFVHIWKRQHRSSKACASLLTALYQLCQGWPWLLETSSSPVSPQPHPSHGRTAAGRAAQFGLDENTRTSF